MDEQNEPATEAVECAERIVELDADDGVVIYDRNNEQSWIRSDGAVPVDERR
jgi:hypothetical protein